MANYADRYGIPAHEVDNLSARFKKQRLIVGFGSFNNFLKFCAESGYKPGMLMKRYDPHELHSPENTYFCERRVVETQPKPKEEETEITIEPREGVCSSCKKKICKCSGSGCMVYQKAYVDNWNKNIHRKIQIQPVGRQFFQYEHPDLIREGIIFMGGTP